MILWLIERTPVTQVSVNAQDDLSGGYLLAKYSQNCIKCSISVTFYAQMMVQN